MHLLLPSLDYCNINFYSAFGASKQEFDMQTSNDCLLVTHYIRIGAKLPCYKPLKMVMVRAWLMYHLTYEDLYWNSALQTKHFHMCVLVPSSCLHSGGSLQL